LKPYDLAPEARADLDGIWNYIAARSSPETATGFLWRLQETFGSIAQSPSIGVPAPGAPKPDARKFPMGNYMIYYRLARRRVTILRVLHGKRQQRSALRHRPR
jgi:toxin ParE1/3/4